MKTYKKEDLIDRKILFANIVTNRFVVHEGKINEFSPSGNYVKIDHDWHYLEKIAFLEIFDLKERPTMRFK